MKHPNTVFFVIRGVFHWLPALALALLFIGCTSLSSNHAEVVANGLPKDAKSILDAQFREIHLKGPFVWSIYALFRQIHEQTQLAISTAMPSAETYKRPVNDRSVKIDMMNVDLKTVLDEMCRQAGWSYFDGPKGLLFDDRVGNFILERGKWERDFAYKSRPLL